MRAGWFSRIVAAAIIIAFCAFLWLGAQIAVNASTIFAMPDFSGPQQQAWTFIGFIAAVGALTTALIQLVRMMVPVRGLFHRGVISDFFLVPHEHVTALLSGTPYHWPRRTSTTVYDLPLEQLCAQLSLAAEAAFDNPAHSRTLAAMLGPEVNLGIASSSTPEGQQARGRAIRILQRRVDSLQIHAGTSWRLWLRTWVLVVAITISFVATQPSIRNKTWPEASAYLLFSLAAGTLAAFLAMCFRDLVAIVENKRRA